MDKNRFLSGEKEYSFLKTHPDLKNIAYLVVSGSHGYGTQVDGSDIDLRGFLVEDRKYLLGCGTFEQYEDETTDTVIYGLKKFFSLCCAANPNALELLGADEESVVIMSEAGRMVRSHADMFLSKRVISSFGNYATAQFRRLSNALCHDQFSAEQQEKHLHNTLMSAMGHFNRVYSSFDKNALRLYIEEDKIMADIHLKGYPLRHFVGIYSEMREIVRNYDKLNYRNRKKDAAHLNKHAMHLVRLLLTGTDILDGRGILMKRKKEHDLLMDLRRGEYSYAEICAIAETCQKQFDAAAARTLLPDEPDRARIEALQMEIFEKVLVRGSLRPFLY